MREPQYSGSIVALMTTLKDKVLPTLTMWETFFDRKVVITIREDNEATQKILKSGKFEKKLGHVWAHACH